MTTEMIENHGMPERLPNTAPVTTTPRPEDPLGAPRQEEGSAGVSRTRFALAFLVAAASDLVSSGTVVAPPVQWAVDLVTACILFVILGWRWALLPGLVAEAIPGVAVFPVWTMVVAAVALWGRIK
jgi:hypothetical protein